MENPVRKTTFFVVKNAEKVKINREKIRELAEKWKKEGVEPAVFPLDFHFASKDREKTLDYLILLDALNFCFWPAQIASRIVAGKPKNKKWEIEYQGKKYGGYFGLSIALKKFFEENPEKANLKYFSKISKKEFLEIFQGGKGLQFLEKRWKIARAVSKKIEGKYGNSLNFMKSAKGKADILVNKIYKELPFFDDISFFKGRKILFLKRAQILVSDIWGTFGGKGIGNLKNMGYLTCFPDYKIPQILNNFAILDYSEDLAEKIKNRKIIKNGSREEIEIRSATIWAVEYIKEELTKRGINFRSFEIDWILWNKSQETKMENPYHLTPTFFY